MSAHRIRPARLLASLALIVCVLAGPLLPLLSAAAGPSSMACCRKGAKHSCCARKANTGGPAIAARTGCGKSSCCKAQPPAGAAALAAPVHRTLPARVETPLLIAGTGAIRPVPVPDPLLQRPPPFLSLL